jgi:hypothetical protein
MLRNPVTQSTFAEACECSEFTRAQKKFAVTHSRLPFLFHTGGEVKFDTIHVFWTNCFEEVANATRIVDELCYARIACEPVPVAYPREALGGVAAG